MGGDLYELGADEFHVLFLLGTLGLKVCTNGFLDALGQFIKRFGMRARRSACVCLGVWGLEFNPRMVLFDPIIDVSIVLFAPFTFSVTSVNLLFC